MRASELQKISWMEYRDHISCGPGLVLMPVGSIEQHGPHLPLGTDVIIPTDICRSAAEQTGAILGASISYGARSTPRFGGGQHFCGTTSVDHASLVSQVRDLVREFARHGVSGVAFVCGHMENTWVLNDACELALRDATALGHQAPRMMNVGYWEFLDDVLIKNVFGEKKPNWPLEHAGVMETSLMLHLHPELVHMDRLSKHGPMELPVYDMWPYDQEKVPSDGVLDSALEAGPSTGKLLFSGVVERFTSALRKEFGLSDR